MNIDWLILIRRLVAFFFFSLQAYKLSNNRGRTLSRLNLTHRFIQLCVTTHQKQKHKAHVDSFRSGGHLSISAADD